MDHRRQDFSNKRAMHSRPAIPKGNLTAQNDERMTSGSLPLPKPLAYVMLLFCAFIWGVAFLFQKSATEHLGPVTFVTLRAITATLVLVPFAIWERKTLDRNTNAVSIKLTVATGAVFLVSAILQQWGMTTATVTNTGLLTGLYVVATPVFTWILLRKAPSKNLWIASLLSFTGVWLLGGGGFHSLGSGDRLIAVSALLWGFYVVLLGMAARSGAPLQRTMLQLLTVAVLGALLSVATETVTLSAMKLAMWDILFVGVVSTALTFAMFTIAVRETSATLAAVIVSTETVFAALAGYLALDERLTLLGLFGAALIIAAVIWVQLPNHKSR
jgi:drug/metabolite transporter (DMT)-like permease